MKLKYLPSLILLGLFTLAFGLLIFSARQDSPTTDEAIHQYAGYTYLTRRDFRLDPEHPPLLKELGAVPLLFQPNLKVPDDLLWNKAQDFFYDSWSEARKLGEAFYYSVGNDPQKLLFYGRLPFIFLTLILGWASFTWAKKLYGLNPALLAAFLTLFFPHFLAHGRLINTDLGVTLFMFLSVYFWSEYLKNLKRRDVLLTGLFVGLALASKFTALILLPILAVLAVIRLAQTKEYTKVILGYLGILGLGFGIVWLSYGFSAHIVPGTFPAELLKFQKYRFLLFPADYFKGIYLMTIHALLGHHAYLLGQNSTSGWWYYFPVAIFYKTPLPLFILLALTIAFWRKLRLRNHFDDWVLLLPPLIYLGVAMFSRADLGLRHVLPIFPFLIVFVSRTINLVDFRPRFFNVAYITILLWYFAGTLLSFPNFLSYFNELAGGPNQGYKVLSDSNVDWGQDMYRLKSYLDEHKIPKVYLVYPWNGDAALQYYGIDFVPLYPEMQNIHGPVAISVTYLHLDAYSWLKQYPSEQITPGVLLFNLP